MDELKAYIKKLDESSYDHRDITTINREFQDVNQKLAANNQNDLLHLSDLDRQVFSVQKSFDIKSDMEKGTIDGLGWNMSGTQTKEDGSVVPLYWPNVAGYKQEDFEYFEKRYKESKNLFVRTEYGLMIYFGNTTTFSKHNDFKKSLASDLFELSQEYLKKADKGGEHNYYSQDFLRTIELAFGIALRSKSEPQLTDISKFIFEIHQTWDITKKDIQRILLDLSGIMTEAFSHFNRLIDFQKVIDKNFAGARELEKTYVWGAIYAVDKNISIEQKRGKPSNDLLNYKALLYEKLSKEAEERGNLASVDFAEKALRIYEQLKDDSNTKRLESVYSGLRGKFELSEIRKDLPEEYYSQMLEKVRTTIPEIDENAILMHFVLTPWYPTVSIIKERADSMRKESVLMSMMPSSIVDKYGNTIDTFFTDDEKEKLSFWNSYSFSYQIGTQTMHSFFNEAYLSGKLNYNTVVKFLETTWYNEKIVRNYHGREIEIKPIDTLKPGLKRIFEELDRFKSNNEHQFDYITIVDSLTLKIEGLLRFFCEKIGIATFKTRTKGEEKLVMEKLIDDLLADLAHKPDYKPDQETGFDEEDRVLIKYIMTEKTGLNLRNVVAHSLLDANEYGFELILILFCIIIKLSKYRFEEITEPKKE